MHYVTLSHHQYGSVLGVPKSIFYWLQKSNTKWSQKT